MTDEQDREDARALWFPSRRGPARHFKDWNSYLEGETLPDVLMNRGRRPAMAGDEYNADRDVGRALRVPWMTFVLGSGCLSAADIAPGAGLPATGELDSLRSRLESDLGDLVESYPQLRLDRLAAEFIELLAVERTGAPNVEEALASVSVRTDVTPRAHSARVALAAALATQFYARALGARPLMQVADREVVVLPNAHHQGEIVAEIIRPLEATLKLLVAPDGVNADASMLALSELAKAALVSLAAFRIRRLHVELLTAFAWYFLTAGTRVYPGWSELMLLRALNGDSSWFRDEVVTAPSAESRLRPSILTLEGQDDWISDRIIDVTNNSWESRKSRALTTGTSTPRDEFYDLIARFLSAQAEFRMPMPKKRSGAKEREGGGVRPVPSCFVSSFDLELEMALWDQQQPFVVVLPVFAFDDAYQGTATLHWLWTTIVPGPPEFDRAEPKRTEEPRAGLRLPSGLCRPGGWQRVDERMRPALPGRGMSIPIVVRLAGSPLMERPRLAGESTLFHHALLLDEHTAFQQAHRDILLARDEPGERDNGALPAFLSEDVGITRTWVFLGTQLSDPAVRLRIASQHVAVRASSAMNSNKQGKGEGRAGESPRDGVTARKTSGILVNAMSQASEREIFLWQEFDVVDGRHTDLMTSLGEILEQMRAATATATSSDAGGEEPE